MIYCITKLEQVYSEKEIGIDRLIYMDRHKQLMITKNLPNDKIPLYCAIKKISLNRRKRIHDYDFVLKSSLPKMNRKYYLAIIVLRSL